MRVVVSAFEPFGGRKVNRSLQLMRKLRQYLRFKPVVLPVAFAALPGAVRRTGQPDVWLMLGESGGARGLRLEARAWNRIDARIPDNAGDQPRGVRVAPGPALRQPAVPVAELVVWARRAGAPASLSRSAGRFACNAAYYLALARLPEAQVLFVHVPTDPRFASDSKLLDGLLTVLLALIERGPAGRRPPRRPARPRPPRPAPRSR